MLILILEWVCHTNLNALMCDIRHAFEIDNPCLSTRFENGDAKSPILTPKIVNIPLKFFLFVHFEGL